MRSSILSLLGGIVFFVLPTGLYGQTKSKSYSYTIKDSTPCSCYLSVQSPVIQNATGCNTSNGSVSVSVLGGSGNYDFSWSDAFGKIVSTSKDATGLAPGYYFLNAKDKNNSLCKGQGNFEVGSDLKILSTITSNSNCNVPNGAIAISATGGSGSYTYEWTLPDNDKVIQKNITGLKAGQYTVKVTDTQKGCSASKSVTVKNLVNLSVTKLGQTDNTSCLTPNGSINVTVTGGSSKYKYYWYDALKGSYVGYTEDLQNSKGGQYSLYVIDENSGCINYQSYEIIEKTIAPSFTFTTSANTACAAPFNGSIDLTPSGTGSFSVSWINDEQAIVSSVEDPDNLSSGRYGFTIKDNGTGCSVSMLSSSPQAPVVTDESGPAINVSMIDLMDNSDCLKPNGKIKIATSSDNPDLTLNWSGPENFTASTETIEGLTAGLYTLQVTTSCSTNQPPNITETLITSTFDSPVSLNLLSIISDPDDNLDASTIQIIESATSGATCSISDDYFLTLNYSGKPFKGKDYLRIRACDLMSACSEQVITIDVDQSGGVIVYNAIAPGSTGDNKYMRIMNLPDFENHVTIFNRWGDKVFDVQNYDNDLTGKRFEGVGLSGQALPSGTYFYKVEIKGEKTLSGYLALKN